MPVEENNTESKISIDGLASHFTISQKKQISLRRNRLVGGVGGGSEAFQVDLKFSKFASSRGARHATDQSTEYRWIIQVLSGSFQFGKKRKRSRSVLLNWKKFSSAQCWITRASNNWINTHQPSAK